MLADVIEMLGSPLPAVHLEAQEDSLVSVLLSQGTFVSEGNGEPLELSLILALAGLPVSLRAMPIFEACLAAAAHEESGNFPSMAPLMLTRFLCRMSFQLLSRGIFLLRSAKLGMKKLLTPPSLNRLKTGTTASPKLDA